MRVGIVAPIACLKKYCTTRIQYCIPDLLKVPEYSKFYKSRQEKMDLIILDFRDLILPRRPSREDTHESNIDIVISPSYAFKKNKTLEVFRDFFHRELRTNSEICGCIEGATLEEAQVCIKELESSKISYLALPSHMQLVFKGERPSTSLPIIFLDNRTSPYECKGRLGDILITSLPVRLGLLGRLNNDSLPSPDSLDFFTKENLYPTVIEKNIEDTLEYYEEII